MPKEEKSLVEKPGFKTTEFWLSVLVILAGLVMASGLVLEGSMAGKIVGGVLAVLSQLGYTASRSKVKAKS